MSSQMKLKDNTEKWIVCRICLQQPSTGGLKSIFHQNDKQDLTLMILECGGIPIKRFDHYPDGICTKCLNNLQVAYTFRKTSQESHNHLSRLISPVAGELKIIAFVDEDDIERTELKVHPKDAKTDIDAEMVDMSNVSDDKTAEFVPEKRELTKFATIEYPKCSQAVKSEKKQMIPQAKEHAVKNFQLGGRLKEEICEKEMISDIFDAFDEGAEEFIQEDSNEKDATAYKKLELEVKPNDNNQKIYENEIGLVKAFEDKNYKLIEEDKTEKKECLELKTQLFSNSSENEFVQQSTSGKINGKHKELERKKHKLLINAEEFLPIKKMLYDCKDCGISFSQSKDLIDHIKTHNNNCKVCGRLFATYKSVKRHLLTHTKERPFSCDICGSTFAQKGTLNRHIATHTGSSNIYKCEICNRPFIQKFNLTIHMKTHPAKQRLQVLGP